MAHHARIFFGLPASVLIEVFLEMGFIIYEKNNYSIRNNTATQDVGFCHHTMCVPFPGVLGLEVTVQKGLRGPLLLRRYQ